MRDEHKEVREYSREKRDKIRDWGGGGFEIVAQRDRGGEILGRGLWPQGQDLLVSERERERLRLDY